MSVNAQRGVDPRCRRTARRGADVVEGRDAPRELGLRNLEVVEVRSEDVDLLRARVGEEGGTRGVRESIGRASCECLHQGLCRAAAPRGRLRERVHAHPLSASAAAPAAAGSSTGAPFYLAQAKSVWAGQERENSLSVNKCNTRRERPSFLVGRGSNEFVGGRAYGKRACAWGVVVRKGLFGNARDATNKNHLAPFQPPRPPSPPPPASPRGPCASRVLPLVCARLHWASPPPTLFEPSRAPLREPPRAERESVASMP
jgi:hypothetical protein